MPGVKQRDFVELPRLDPQHQSVWAAFTMQSFIRQRRNGEPYPSRRRLVTPPKRADIRGPGHSPNLIRAEAVGGVFKPSLRNHAVTLLLLIKRRLCRLGQTLQRPGGQQQNQAEMRQRCDQSSEEGQAHGRFEQCFDRF